MHLRRRSLEDCLNERPPDNHERQELNLKRAELSTGPSALFRTNPDDEHQLTIDGNPWIQNPAAEPGSRGIADASPALGPLLQSPHA